MKEPWGASGNKGERNREMKDNPGACSHSQGCFGWAEARLKSRQRSRFKAVVKAVVKIYETAAAELERIEMMEVVLCGKGIEAANVGDEVR